MTNLVFFGGVAICLALLLALVFGIWRLLRRSLLGLALGVGAALVTTVVTGPYVFVGLMALTFAAHDVERRQSEPAAVAARPYERPATLPAQISHRFSVEITLKDAQGNRSRQDGEVIVTVVHDPKAFDGIGDGRLWTASGTPLSFSVGTHRGVSHWDARKIVEQCLLRRQTGDYGKLYEALAALTGRCHSFIGAQFVTVDGQARPIDWPADVKVAIAVLTTTGPLAANDPVLQALATR
jgi:hypothetical protein